MPHRGSPPPQSVRMLPISTVSLQELQRNPEALLDRVEAREHLVVVRGGRPVAELRPVPATQPRFAAIRPLRRSLHGPGRLRRAAAEGNSPRLRGAMRLLLDTHVFLWYITADPKPPATFKAASQDSTNEVYLSAASAWEAVISTTRQAPLPASTAD